MNYNHPNDTQIALLRLNGYKRNPRVINDACLYFHHDHQLMMTWDIMQNQFKQYTLTTSYTNMRLIALNKLVKTLNNLCNQTTNN